MFYKPWNCLKLICEQRVGDSWWQVWCLRRQWEAVGTEDSSLWWSTGTICLIVLFGTHWNPSQPCHSQHTSHMMGCYRSGWVSSHSLENGGELSNVPSHALLQYRSQGCLQLSSKLCSPHSLFIESPPSWSDLHSRRAGRFHGRPLRPPSLPLSPRQESSAAGSSWHPGVRYRDGYHWGTSKGKCQTSISISIKRYKHLININT